jgi:trehalose 6-phosphate synthase/phosphatase
MCVAYFGSTGVLKHFPVEVLNGKDYLEVRPAGVNKGVMVERIYKRMHKEFKGNKMKASQKAVDFVLCIGDDDSDEKMFKVLNGIEEGLTGDKQLRSYPVTVGKKPSEVSWRAVGRGEGRREWRM